MNKNQMKKTYKMIFNMEKQEKKRKKNRVRSIFVCVSNKLSIQLSLRLLVILATRSYHVKAIITNHKKKKNDDNIEAITIHKHSIYVP